MNTYAEYGNREREQLLKLYAALGVTKYKFTSSDGYAKVDGIYQWNGTNYVVEAKVRQCRRNTYPSHLIEEEKYQELASWVSKGFKPVYVNFFWDGVIIYDLSQRIATSSLVFHPTDMPKASAQDKGVRTKSCGFLEVDPAQGDLTLTTRPKGN